MLFGEPLRRSFVWFPDSNSKAQPLPLTLCMSSGEAPRLHNGLPRVPPVMPRLGDSTVEPPPKGQPPRPPVPELECNGVYSDVCFALPLPLSRGFRPGKIFAWAVTLVRAETYTRNRMSVSR